MKKTLELFDNRNERKKTIEFTSKKSTINYRVGDFVRYSEWINLGNEISKDGFFRRPCIILHNRLWNGLYLIMPFTTKYHHWMTKYYFNLKRPEEFNIKWGRGLLNQIKLIDRKRFHHRLCSKRANISVITSVLQRYVELISL